VNATLCLAYAIAWAGPGRGSVSPVLVQSISTTVTAFFFAGLMWLTRRMPQPTEVRRQAARVLPFRPFSRRTAALAGDPRRPHPDVRGTRGARERASTVPRPGSL